jgi:Domain of unknown function (DUF4389)
MRIRPAPGKKEATMEASNTPIEPIEPIEPSDYPVTFSVDYPDRDLNRLTTFFRIFTVIPIYIVLALVVGYYYGTGEYTSYAGAGIGLLTLPTVLMLLFRKKYPRWWFDWNLEVSRFSNRVGIYIALMDDTYPSTDEQQAVHLDFPYPDAENDLQRGMPLIKWLLAIPHYIVLIFLGIGAFFVVIFAWFAILFTGRFPRGAFDFVEGVLRWENRVIAYAFTLVTDKYPPFRLGP